MIVGIGHDLQLLRELEGRQALLEPDVMFSASELAYAAGRADRVAALFTAKEAFFKALPAQSGWRWSELEVGYEEAGRPVLHCHGALARLMSTNGWNARISLSHSGEYVSGVVIIYT